MCRADGADGRDGIGPSVEVKRDQGPAVAGIRGSGVVADTRREGTNGSHWISPPDLLAHFGIE